MVVGKFSDFSTGVNSLFFVDWIANVSLYSLASAIFVKVTFNPFVIAYSSISSRDVLKNSFLGLAKFTCPSSVEHLTILLIFRGTLENTVGYFISNTA